MANVALAMTDRNFFITSGGTDFACKAHSTTGGKFCGNGKGVGICMLCLSLVSLNCRDVSASCLDHFGGLSVASPSAIELSISSLLWKLERIINMQCKLY